MLQKYFEEHIQVINRVAKELADSIEQCADLLVATVGAGGKLLVMGNGGSAADAQHIAAEFVGRFLLERRALPAIALTTDTSILTAVGNDYGFDEVFKRQVEALAEPRDIVIGISTSGHSSNVLEALKVAKKIGCKTIGMLGKDGGRIAPLVDLALTVPSTATPRIQEAHLVMIHILCDLVEKKLFSCIRSAD